MVLDAFDKDNDKLIFKNTYDDPENGQPKKFEISRTDFNAPEELYFVHIQIEDMDNLADQKEREAIKKKTKEAIDANYFVAPHVSDFSEAEWYDLLAKIVVEHLVFQAIFTCV